MAIVDDVSLPRACQHFLILKEDLIVRFELCEPLARDVNTSLKNFEQKNFKFFYTPPWLRVLFDTYGFPIYFGQLINSHKYLFGVLPVMEINSFLTGRRGVCLPFSDECPPLLEDGIAPAELIQPMLDIGRRRGWNYLEIRGGEAPMPPQAIPHDRFLVHDLALESTDELQFKKLKESHRRNIHKAQKEGVEIHRLQSRESIAEYFRLHCLTRQRHGLPPQSWRFFRKIHEHILAPGHGFVMLARCQGRWVAGAVYFFTGTTALYKFGASDLAYQHLRPNNLLMWEAIRAFRQMGLTSLSFGRTEPDNAGLLQFKRGWGASERSLTYYRIGLKRPVCARVEKSGNESGPANKLMRKMPIPLLRILGTLAYRHMG